VETAFRILTPFLILADVISVIKLYALQKPKGNEEILFEASVAANGTEVYSEDYPHAVVKHLIKEEVDKVISKYSDNYALDIYFRKPDYLPNDNETREFLENVVPFTRASDITIESYSEKYLETIFSHIYIVCQGTKYADAELAPEILNEVNISLHKIPSKFSFYSSDNNMIEKCKLDIKEYNSFDLNTRNDLADSYAVLRFDCNKDTNYQVQLDKKASKFADETNTTKKDEE